MTTTEDLAIRLSAKKGYPAGRYGSTIDEAEALEDGSLKLHFDNGDALVVPSGFIYTHRPERPSEMAMRLVDERRRRS